MSFSPLNALVARLESVEAIDALRRPAGRTVRRLIPDGAPKDALSGVWLGHALAVKIRPAFAHGYTGPVAPAMSATLAELPLPPWARPVSELTRTVMLPSPISVRCTK